MGYIIVVIGMVLIGVAAYRFIRRKKSEEVSSKPIWQFAVIGAILFIAGGILMPSDDIIESEEVEERGKEQSEEVAIDSTKESKIIVDEKISFGDFTVKVGAVEIEDTTLRLPLEWANDSFPDKTKLMQAFSLDVKQGEELLDEITEAWADPNSDVYFPNSPGGSFIMVKLEYELIDENSPIDISIVPFNERDNSETISVEIE